MHCQWEGKPAKFCHHVEGRPSHGHRQRAQKLVKIARVVPEISCRTDRQTDRQTLGVLITILRRRSRWRSNKLLLLTTRPFTSATRSNWVTIQSELNLYNIPKIMKSWVRQCCLGGHNPWEKNIAHVPAAVCGFNGRYH